MLSICFLKLLNAYPSLVEEHVSIVGFGEVQWRGKIEATEAGIIDAAVVEHVDLRIVELYPRVLRCSRRRTFTNVRVVVARFSCAAVDEDANKLEYVGVDRLIWLAEMFNGIWSHVNPFRKAVLIIDLASRHSRDVKVESLEVKYEVVWYVFQTGPASVMSVINFAELK